MAQPWINPNRPPTTGRGSVEFGDLTGGMRLDIPSNNLKPGEFTMLDGVIVTPSGVARQPRFDYAVTEASRKTPVNSLFTGYGRSILRAVDSSNAVFGILLTSTKIWKITDLTTTALSELYWSCTYSFPLAVWATAPLVYTFPGSVHTITLTPTLSIALSAGTGTATYSFKNDMFVKVGDIITFSYNADFSAHANDFTGTVITVTNTVITVGSITGTPTGSYRGITMKRVASTDTITGDEQYLDSGYTTNRTFITGIDMPLSEYNPTSGTIKKLVNIGESDAIPLTPASYSATGPTVSLNTFTASTAAFHKSWLFMGDIKDASGRYYNRIRWSNPLAPLTDFSAVEDYLDLGSTEARIVKLIPLGDYLICFTTNDIWYGYSVSLPGIPLAFNVLNMRGLGLVGPKAVCSAMGGLFFVTYQGIFFANSLEPVDIGTPVQKQTLRVSEYPQGTQVVHDPANFRVLFGFTSINPHTIDDLWSFSYRTKAWSKCTRPTLFVDSLFLDSKTEVFCTYSETQYNNKYILLRQDQPGEQITYLSASTLLDSDESNMIVTTGDISLGASDIVKDWFRLELGIQEDDLASSTRTEQLNFMVSVAIDGSSTYTDLGTLTVYVGKASGQLNFKAHGAYARFRISFAVPTTEVEVGTSPNKIGSFTIEQIIIDVKAIAPYQAIK